MKFLKRIVVATFKRGSGEKIFNRPEAVVEAVEGGAAQAPPLKLKPDRKYPVRSSTVLVTCGVDSVTVSPFFV